MLGRDPYEEPLTELEMAVFTMLVSERALAKAQLTMFQEVVR